MSFDTAVGTPASAWRHDPRLAQSPSLQLGDVAALVVVAAHPDDETLGAGGLLLAASRQGIAVHVVIVTDGAASHPSSPTTTPDALAAVRERETEAALAVLAPGGTLHRLGLPDGGIDERRQLVAEGVRAVLDQLEGPVLVASTWRGDGHRDHRVVGEVCAELCTATGATLIEYPIWMWHRITPDSAGVPWPRLRRLTLSDDDRRAKRAAIDAYPSQTQPLSTAVGDEAVLGPHLLEHFAGDETFIVSDRPADGTWFDELYARHSDPWGYDSRWYEKRKRALTTAVLRREHYSRALELGCSTGALTADLAARCDAVVAVDAAEAAVERAQQRLATESSVLVIRSDVREGLPPGRFDLVVLSELGYYLEPRELDSVLSGILRSLADGGELLVCHWRHPSNTFRQSADAVHDAVAALGLHAQAHHEEPDLLLDLYSVDANSVARLGGLL